MPEPVTQVDFPFIGRRTVRCAFDAGPISSDGGLLPLRRLDALLGLVSSFAAAIRDERDPRYVEQPLEVLLRQRIFGISAGYEDCNDHDTLRRDPVFKTVCNRDPLRDPDLASQPTLSRLENAVGPVTCYRLARALLESYFARHPRRPVRIILDLDLTDDPTHGQQQLSFFNAFYDEHCYLPLLVFDQDGDLLTAVLLPGKPRGARPVVAVLERLIARLRLKWPGLRILIRGDAGFASPEVYWMCRRLGVDFLIGIGPNSRLKKLAARLEERARRKFLRTAKKVRLFASARYRARNGWPRGYRVIIKAEHSAMGSNVRFVLTNLSGLAAQLYAHYVDRGEACENSIKDLKNVLKGDRLSCHRFWANQFRLLLHAAAYVLLYALRLLARGTELAAAQMDTLRLRLLKIGVRVESTARRIWFHLSSGHPWQSLWATIARRSLGAAPFG